MGAGVKKLELLGCTGCCFFSYIALDLLFIQDPLCQIRLVIKIKSTGKSAELESLWKGPCCPKSATLASSCYGSIVLFLLLLKGKVWKTREFIKRISVQRAEHSRNHFLLSCQLHGIPCVWWLCQLQGPPSPKSPLSRCKKTYSALRQDCEYTDSISENSFPIHLEPLKECVSHSVGESKAFPRWIREYHGWNRP